MGGDSLTTSSGKDFAKLTLSDNARYKRPSSPVNSSHESRADTAANHKSALQANDRILYEPHRLSKFFICFNETLSSLFLRNCLKRERLKGWCNSWILLNRFLLTDSTLFLKFCLQNKQHPWRSDNRDSPLSYETLSHTDVKQSNFRRNTHPSCRRIA